ncbi:MAG TPA: glycosyltransferase family 2 protein [Clostridium sp.]|uniref:glycosyltransferase family 2 protein n=1 Tax=Clostridium sp. TaxID=1506 RepID=UPI002F932DC9
MIHVITAVHNRYSITEKLIDQLLRQTYKDIHLILVDDGSTDGTADMVNTRFPNSTIITGNGNLWWGGALHKAYKWIDASCNDKEEYVLISNDDVEFESDYIEKGVKYLKTSNKTLISGVGIGNITHKVVDLPIIWDFPKFKGNPVLDLSLSGNCVSTRSLFCRTTDIIKIGGFHPILLPHYLSDYEWTMRASKKGYSIRAFNDLTYIVKEDTTGLRVRKQMTGKQLMSKKSNANPIYRLSFLLMATPVNYWLSAMKSQFERM